MDSSSSSEEEDIVNSSTESRVGVFNSLSASFFPADVEGGGGNGGGCCDVTVAATLLVMLNKWNPRRDMTSCSLTLSVSFLTAGLTVQANMDVTVETLMSGNNMTSQLSSAAVSLRLARKRGEFAASRNLLHWMEPSRHFNQMSRNMTPPASLFPSSCQNTQKFMPVFFIKKGNMSLCWYLRL